MLGVKCQVPVRFSCCKVFACVYETIFSVRKTCVLCCLFNCCSLMNMENKFEKLEDLIGVFKD